MRGGRRASWLRWTTDSGTSVFVDEHIAGIASGGSDLLGAVAVAVEAGLADQHLDAAAEPAVGGFLIPC
jgi:hypothetical protein